MAQAVSQTEAYVLPALHGEFEKDVLDIDSPDVNECLVKITATGICHSDLNVVNGTSPGEFPMVLGHEGTGVILQTGPAVKHVKPGDKVILCYTHCTQCLACLRGDTTVCEKWTTFNLRSKRNNGKKTWSKGDKQYGNFLSQGAFAQHVLIDSTGVVKVADDADLVKLAGGIGCGIVTGSGAVFNTLRGFRPGSTIAVFGVGAVGAGAIMAARNSPFGKIIAVDLHQSRLDIAIELGATHTVLASEGDAALLLQERYGGVDFAVEATGIPAVVETAYNSIRAGGTLATVGIAPRDKVLQLPISAHVTGNKHVVGVAMGQSNSRVFIPFLVELASQGRLPIEKLAKTYPIKDVNKAVAAMKDGSVIKPILVW